MTQLHFFQQTLKKIRTVKYGSHIWNLHRKCNKMSTNKPIVGPVVLELTCMFPKKQDIFSVLEHAVSKRNIKGLIVTRYIVIFIQKNRCYECTWALRSCTIKLKINAKYWTCGSLWEAPFMDTVSGADLVIIIYSWKQGPVIIRLMLLSFVPRRVLTIYRGSTSRITVPHPQYFHCWYQQKQQNSICNFFYAHFCKMKKPQNIALWWYCAK